MLWRGFVISLTFFFLAFPARAQNPEQKGSKDEKIFFEIVPKEDGTESAPIKKLTKVDMAMQYFSRCTEELYQDVNDIARGDFCMCSADIARNVMSEEELTYLATGTIEDPFSTIDPDRFKKKLEEKVSVPCIHLIVEEVERERCLASDSIQHFFVTQNAYDETCECIAGAALKFVKELGYEMLTASRKRYPNISDDPAKAIMQWNGYKIEISDATKECITAFGHR